MQRMNEEKLPKKNWNVSTWKKKKKVNTTEFLDAGNNNWNEREGN